jgi:glycosyltransferase involved in cell wall biosynthesis
VSSGPAADDPHARLGVSAEALRRLGVRTIHSFSWRDLDDPDAGGSELHHDAIFTRWAAAGLDIVHRSSTADRPRNLDRNGYRVVQRGGRYGVFPRAIVAEVLRRSGPRDAVVEIWNGVPWVSPLWHRGPGVTWLHHVHGDMWDAELPAMQARFGRALESRIAPPWYRRRHVVTLAESSRQELLELGFPAHRLRVVPPGVDPGFSPAPAGPTPLVPPGMRFVIAVGRLVKVKRFHTLVDAVRVARERVGDLGLVIVGEGPERAHIQAHVSASGATDWVRLPGRVDDAELVAMYRGAEAVLSASFAEGWGMTLTEAAACGTPAIATDVTGHRGAVVDGRTGILVGNVGDLGPALADLLEEPERHRRLSVAAAERAATLSWDRCAADNLEVLLASAAEHRLRQAT